jgi:Mn-containing catalase
MFVHNKRLQYTVRVAAPNPGLANLLLEQFGGPQGELAAACRYFTQAVSEEDPGRRDMLFDIATEELSHLEIIGSIVAMLNKGAKGQLAEGVEQEAELYRSLTSGGNDSHVTSLLYGGGPALTNSAGVPWTAAYIDTIGEPTADLRSNIAAEARAKIVYERLINVTDDPGIQDALGFLMTREIAHQKSFEKALHSIQPIFHKANCRACRSSPMSTTTCPTAVMRRAGRGIRDRAGSSWRSPSRQSTEAMGLPAFRYLLNRSSCCARWLRAPPLRLTAILSLAPILARTRRRQCRNNAETRFAKDGQLLRRTASVQASPCGNGAAMRGPPAQLHAAVLAEDETSVP